MDCKKYNDYELVYMVRENDDESRSILFKKYEPILRKIAGEYYNKYDSFGYEYDDFYQEAVIAFQESLSLYDENKNSIFYTFINICVRRRLNSFSRNISRSKNNIIIYDYGEISDNFLVEEDNAVSNIDYLQFVSICKDAIYSLPSEASAIMELRLNGFTYREIGELLDIPSSSVEYKSRSGRRLLRRMLRNYYCK